MGQGGSGVKKIGCCVFLNFFMFGRITAELFPPFSESDFYFMLQPTWETVTTHKTLCIFLFRGVGARHGMRAQQAHSFFCK